MQKILIAALPLFLFLSCKKEEQKVANLVLKFKFDSTQVRFNNIGQPSTVAAGNAALSPVFNKMSAHYVELAPAAFTQLGQGAVLYRAPESSTGGSNAIDFEQSKFAANGEVFYSIPLTNVPKGEYEWLRISLAYQNYDIKYRVDTTISGIPFNQDVTGTVASFIGFNSYIKSHTIKTQVVQVNANKKQGYWGFESSFNIGGTNTPFVSTGQGPDGGTTVVNPLFATSPVPPGSCVVTAAFSGRKLVITGSETKDIVIEISLSTNKSFEWKEIVNNGKWDILKGEQVVDMGIRGMIPTIQ